MKLRNYIKAINYRTLVAMVLSFIATWVCYQFDLIFNLDLTLISVAVIFPLVFTLGSAFQRREKALEHLGRSKGALLAIKYCFSFSDSIDKNEQERISKEIDQVKLELIDFLYSKSSDKKKLNDSIRKIQDFIGQHREALGRSLSLRVYRLMRDVIMGVENSISIKVHRTPLSIRAYCELFIYVFPFFYAPTLINNIGNEYIVAEQIMGNPLVFIVFGLNMVISFFLITLFNIQEQIEDPFDQDGLDDIKMKNFLLDY